MSEKPKVGEEFDRIFPINQLDNGSLECIRHKPGSIEFGTVIPLKDGMNMPQDLEILRMTPGKDGPYKDVEVLYKSDGSKGPVKVNSKAYRDNWDDIWGNKSSEEWN